MARTTTILSQRDKPYFADLNGSRFAFPATFEKVSWSSSDGDSGNEVDVGNFETGDSVIITYATSVKVADDYKNASEQSGLTWLIMQMGV